MKAEEFREQNGIESEFTAYKTKDGRRFDIHIDEFAEQYAELRIQQELQQEREKWKEVIENEVIKARTIHGVWSPDDAKRYYEREVKPRIESK